MSNLATLTRGNSAEKRAHAAVIEAGCELTAIAHDLDPHDKAEAYELAHVRGLLAEALATRQVQPVRVALEWVERLIERDGRENSEYHAPICEIGRTVAGYHDRMGLGRLMNISASCDSGDAA